MTTLTLARLRIYPVKALEGMDVDAWEQDGCGLRLDRRWMIVDPSGQAVGRRQYPALAEIHATIEGDRLVLSARHRPAVEVPIVPEPGPSEPVTIAGESIGVRDVSADANRWLSESLTASVRLVYLPEEWHREVNPALGTRRAKLAFQDELPLRLVGDGSLEDFASRLGRQLPADAFRPNLLIEGAEPYEEDGWRRIRVGGEEIEVVAPAEVAPLETAQGGSGSDPLTVLGGYRTLAGTPRLGALAIAATTTGVLRVGDAVEVLERRTPPVFGDEDPGLHEHEPEPEPEPGRGARAAGRERGGREIRIVRLSARRPVDPSPESLGRADVERNPWEDTVPPEPAAPEPAASEPAAPAPAGELKLSNHRIPDVGQVERLLLAAAVTESAAEAERLALACLAAPVLVTAWSGDALVGLARGWTDGVRDGFLADVALHPDHHGTGAAVDLVRRVLEGHAGIRWVLRASPGSSYLGSALGWTHAGSGWYVSPLVG